VKQFLNARPSEVQNLGEEVLGAARHRNDTYDNPEHEARERKIKEDAKEIKKQLESLKKLTVEFMPVETQDLIPYLINYEQRVFQTQNMYKFDTEVLTIDVLKAHVLSNKLPSDYNTMRFRFNKMLKNIRLVKYRITTKEDGIKHVMPTRRNIESFQEMNGRKSLWIDSSLKLSEEVKKSILTQARAIQFGNSVLDQEREYLIYNLNLGVNWLQGLLPNFKLQELAYSFGARGNAKSVAYYQDSKKLISVNRHNEGSLVHEIGHAIDYKLNKISNSMPWSMRSSYMKKIESIKNRNHKDYLSKPTEIFARLFEVYIYELASKNGQSPFMLFCDPQALQMPELTTESRQWLESCLAKLDGM